MAKDHSLALRRAVVTALRADPSVTAMVGQRVFGEFQPADTAWPFIRYGAPIATPLDASLMSGSAHRPTLHGFAHGPGMDAAASIAAAIVEALDGRPLSVGDGSAFEFFWTRTQIIPDGDEANAFHAICDFSAATS